MINWKWVSIVVLEQSGPNKIYSVKTMVRKGDSTYKVCGIGGWLERTEIRFDLFARHGSKTYLSKGS